MPSTVLLLFSGPIAVGKSAVAKVLTSGHDFLQIATGAYLRKVAAARGIEINRTTLQELGDELDRETDFRWVVDCARESMTVQPSQRRWIFDAVRKHKQLRHFQLEFGPSASLVYFVAEENTLRDRYVKRREMAASIDAHIPYEVATGHANETESRSLSKIANLIIDLDRVDSAAAASQIVGFVDAKMGK